MKTKFVFASLLMAASTLRADPPQRTVDVPPAPQPPPPVVTPLPPQNTTQQFVYNDQIVAPQPALITQDQARAVLEHFRNSYKKLGEPRILIYVNRELVDDKSGLKLSARYEKTSTISSLSQNDNYKDKTNAGHVNFTSAGNGSLTLTSSNDSAFRKSVTTKVDRDNTYRAQERTEPTLADRQTVRDVERLLGRPLRNAGARLADQRVASQLIGDKPLKDIISPTDGSQAEKDRVALKKVADVVIEVLISSRNVTVQEVSGEKTYASPDIQLTAIRLSDAKILGQASSSDILNKGGSPGRLLRTYDVNQITEATALALMEDMMVGVQ